MSAVANINGAGSLTNGRVHATAVDREGREPRSIILVDSRTRDRQCLAGGLVAHGADLQLFAYASFEAWIADRPDMQNAAAVLLNLGGHKLSDPTVADQVKALAQRLGTTPLVILADAEDIGEIMRAIDAGAKGYVPSSVSIELCVEAVRLVMAGGVFVPAHVLLQSYRLTDAAAVPHPLSSIFTARQAEVVEALRRGKANKIIAHELNLRESTVKVHIRTIMKKIKARNRTEAVYKINGLYPSGSGAQSFGRLG